MFLHGTFHSSFPPPLFYIIIIYITYQYIFNCLHIYMYMDCSSNKLYTPSGLKKGGGWGWKGEDTLLSFVFLFF